MNPAPSLRARAATLFLAAGMPFGGLCAEAPAAWPMFRGPNASGIAPQARPPARLGPEENLLWSTPVPNSPSSPCVWGDRIFLTTFADGRLETRAYDGRDGRQLWSAVAPAAGLEEFHQTEGSPAASTPATDGRHVVSYFGSFGLLCHDPEGRELWRHPLPRAQTAGNFGSGTSPLIVGERVILNRDLAPSSSTLGLDLRTGKLLWETPRAEVVTSYGTPIVREQDGTVEIVMAGSLVMRGYDPVTGAERWKFRGLPSYTCTTPVLGDGLIFFAGWSPGKADSPFPTWASTAERQDRNRDGVITPDEFTDGPAWFKAQDLDGNGKLEQHDWETILGLMKRGENVLVAVRPGGSGDITDSHAAWKYTRGLPYVPCPLHYDGRIYLIRDGGMLTSLDARTGAPIYAQERLKNAGGSYYASPVAADGRLYLLSLDGKLSVVRAGGQAPEILHQADFREKTAATPALAGNRLYLRTPTRLLAFGQRDVAAH